jgi:uncharacterized protein
MSVEELRFEWDKRKARDNKRRHDVSFEEAETVFYDEHAILIDDPEHSIGEDRFLLLGLSAGLRILVIAHCYRRSGDLIRIISARKATRNERNVYNRRWQR